MGFRAGNYSLISLPIKKKRKKKKKNTNLCWDIKEPWWCSFWFWVCQLCSKLKAQGKVSSHEKSVKKHTEKKTQWLLGRKLKRHSVSQMPAGCWTFARDISRIIATAHTAAWLFVAQVSLLPTNTFARSLRHGAKPAGGCEEGGSKSSISQKQHRRASPPAQSISQTALHAFSFCPYPIWEPQAGCGSPQSLLGHDFCLPPHILAAQAWRKEACAWTYPRMPAVTKTTQRWPRSRVKV